MEPFLAAFQEFHSPASADPVHFLLLRKEGGLPCVVLGMDRGGNGHHRDSLPPPGRATGPSCRDSSSLGAPRQLLSMPPGCPVLAEKRERVIQGQTAKGEGCRKPSWAGWWGGGDALVAAALLLLLAFPYRLLPEAIALLQGNRKPLAVPSESNSQLLEWVTSLLMFCLSGPACHCCNHHNF